MAEGDPLLLLRICAYLIQSETTLAGRYLLVTCFPSTFTITLLSRN